MSFRTNCGSFAIVWGVALLGLCLAVEVSRSSPTTQLSSAVVGSADWPQLGGAPGRNNAPTGTGIPTEWDLVSGRNIKWRTKLGSQTFGNIVVANHQVYVGTNNTAGYLKRFPATVDLGVLLCFRESDGEFLWQYSSSKHPAGRVHDWPFQGIGSSPVVEGNRLWLVTNRCEVVCLDAEGFRDGENDGPVRSERSDTRQEWDEPHEADIVWKFDMMKNLGVKPHDKSVCSPTIWNDVLFVCTSHGVEQDHLTVPTSDAPSFIAMDKHTGRILWTDSSPGKNILHEQWSSPAVGVAGGIPQVLFPGGDGWLYSFRADRWNDGRPEVLWKCDGNPKDSVFRLGGRSNRSGIAAVPVIVDGRVYFAMGDDPDHGEGPGNLWCIDPTRRGDVSLKLVVDQNGTVVPHQRVCATAPIAGVQLKVIPNPNSAVVWHFDQQDSNGNGKADFEEIMHRTVGSPVVKNDLLFIGDFAGVVHCLDAKSGKPHWGCDLFSTCWATPLIVDGHVFVVNEDADVAILPLSADPGDSLKAVPYDGETVRKPRHKCNMLNSIYTMPVVANNVLYIAAKSELYAIAAGSNDREGPNK